MVATALAGSLGCRQIFGVNKFHAASTVEDAGLPPTNPIGSPNDDASTPAGDGCMSCLRAQCQSQFTACLDEPTCSDFWSCRTACPAGDDRCQNTCRARGWPWNGGAYRVDQTGELEACAATACDAVCGQEHVLGTHDCMACVASQCNDVDLKAYTADVDAQHLESCDARCVAITVSDDRRLAYCDCPRETSAPADSVSRWNARRTCTTTTCAAQCNGAAAAPDLDCLGTKTFISATPTPITYRLVGYGLPTQSEVEGAAASACTITEPDCKSTHGGPYPLTFLPESHFTDPAAVGAQDFAGSADFTMKFRTTFEPFSDHMEVRVAGYRNLLYQVPLLAQDKLTVWWPVASRDELVTKLQAVQPDVATSGSFIVVIVADCEGRALPGVQVEAQLTVESGELRSLQTNYVFGDGQTSAIGAGIAFFSGVPPGTAEITATYQGRFHSKGRVLVVADGSTLLGLGPSQPPNGESL